MLIVRKTWKLNQLWKGIIMKQIELIADGKNKVTLEINGDGAGGMTITQTPVDGSPASASTLPAFDFSNPTGAVASLAEAVNSFVAAYNAVNKNPTNGDQLEAWLPSHLAVNADGTVAAK